MTEKHVLLTSEGDKKQKRSQKVFLVSLYNLTFQRVSISVRFQNHNKPNRMVSLYMGNSPGIILDQPRTNCNKRDFLGSHIHRDT